MDSRRVHGEGLSHEQDYVRERLEDAGDVDEYAAADEKLRQEVRDLEHLTSGSQSADGIQPDLRVLHDNDMSTTPPAVTDGVQPDLRALHDEAEMPTERMEHRQGSALGTAANSQVDATHQVPDAEARARTVQQSGGGTTGS